MSLKRSLAVVALVFSCAAVAQEFRGTILGRITDASGAIVPGATIQVRNIDTNAAVRTTSNDSGNYQVPFLLPGNYAVLVEHGGFKKLERQGIHVSTNQEVTLDLTL